MYRIKRMRTIFSLIGILALLAVQFGGIIPAPPTTPQTRPPSPSPAACRANWAAPATGILRAR